MPGYFKIRKNAAIGFLGPLLTLLLLVPLLSGCITAHSISKLKYTDGVTVETLSSNVSLSYMSSDRSVSGNGVLMFQKPDHVRVVILSPFGTILQEVFMHGEQVTIVDSGNAIAFNGRYEDLPEKGDFSGWRFIYWLIDIDAPDSQRGTVAIERTNRFNQLETAFFDSGVLILKRRADGGFVRYNRYTAVQGAVFPFEITYTTAAKETFSVIFEDPEINVLMSEKSFLPDLKNIRILPLSSLN